MRFKDTLEQNISWAAWHLLDAKYQKKYEAKLLTAWELNLICQQYRTRRLNQSKVRQWYEFRLKRRDRRILKQLNELIREVYKVQVYNHKIDLSIYGVKNNF